MNVHEIAELFADYGIMCATTPSAVNSKTGVARYDVFEHNQPYCYIFQEDTKITLFLIATNELFGPFCENYRDKIEKNVLGHPLFCTICSHQMPLGYFRIPFSHENGKKTWTGRVVIKSRENVNYYCRSCWDFQNSRCAAIKTIKCEI